MELSVRYQQVGILTSTVSTRGARIVRYTHGNFLSSRKLSQLKCVEQESKTAEKCLGSLLAAIASGIFLGTLSFPFISPYPAHSKSKTAPSVLVDDTKLRNLKEKRLEGKKLKQLSRSWREKEPEKVAELVKKLDEYVKLYPDDLVALKASLNFKMDEGKFDQAVPVLDKLIELEPKRLEWRVVRGQAHEFLGGLDKAKLDYEHILKEEPFSAKAFQGMATVMQRNGESSLVLGMLEEAIERAVRQNRAVETANLKLVLAQVQALQGNLTDALTVYERLIQEDPQDFRPYLCQGLVYALMGDQEKAEANFSEFKKLCPKDYAEGTGIEQMVVRAKAASKRFKEEQKRRERGERKGRIMKDMQEPDPMAGGEGAEEEGGAEG